MAADSRLPLPHLFSWGIDSGLLRNQARSPAHETKKPGRGAIPARLEYPRSEENCQSQGRSAAQVHVAAEGTAVVIADVIAHEGFFVEVIVNRKRRKQ